MDKPTSDVTRLNKYLALQLGISRREADDHIAKGRVNINDNPAQLGARVTPSDKITLNNKPLMGTTRLIYLLFHKPPGYVSSRKAQGDTPTIYSLLPSKYHALKTVGRLDKDSSGLLLLTNDGDFTYRMTHPKFYKVKIYEVELDNHLQPLHQQMISDHGVHLEDGVSKFVIEKVESTAQHEHPVQSSGGGAKDADSPRTEAQGQATTTYTITMSEGRNRQIRRTFAALGYTVTALHRTHFGDYSLGDIKSGEHRAVAIP